MLEKPSEIPISEEDWQRMPETARALMTSLWQQAQNLQAEVAHLRGQTAEPQAEAADPSDQPGKIPDTRSKPPSEEEGPEPQRESLAPVTRREETPLVPWILTGMGLGAAIWLVVLAGLWMPLTVANVLAFLVATGATGSLAWQLSEGWIRRRVAIEVDRDGIHERLADRRRRTARWEEIIDIRRKPPAQGGGWCISLQDRGPIEFDSRVEDAHALASLIHARVRGLPLIPPSALPTPTLEEIQTFFQRLAPVRFWNAPFLMRWGTGGCLGGVLWVFAAFATLRMGMWGLTLLSLGIPALLWFWLRLIALRVEVGEQGITLYYVGGGRQHLPWNEITGRDGFILRGLYRDLSLEGGPWGTGRILQFIDTLIARRAEMGGLQLRDKPSEAALTMVDPETGAPPSAAALAEAEEEDKARMTGKELEETAERQETKGKSRS